MAVLLELARHGTEVCSRAEIQEVVWPRGFVTDDALTRCIAQLRRALGGGTGQSGPIETIPRRGYRLTSPPRALASERDCSRLLADTPVPDTLLVLPFQVLSRETEDYLADGLTEILIGKLATTPHLRVISRTTSMCFKGTRAPISEIAGQTGADWVVEGSCMHSGDRVQIVAQLIDARTDAHLWAEDYLRELDDILQLQSEICRKICAAIRLQLGVSEARVPRDARLNGQALRKYLEGRHALNQRTGSELRRAVVLFSDVCQAVPDFAAAFSSRSDARFMLAHYGIESPRNVIDACHSDISHALALNPEHGFAYSGRGAVRFAFEWDMDAAASDLTKALELSPSYLLAMLLLANVHSVRGEFEEANAWLDHAKSLDPLDVGLRMNIGDHQILQRRYEDAVDTLTEALELAPGHRPTFLRRCWALSLAGRATEARAALEQVGTAETGDGPWLEYAAMVDALDGDPAAASAHYRRLSVLAAKSYVSDWSLARAAAAAGDTDGALKHLEHAIGQRSSSVPFLDLTPAFDTVRVPPDFRRLRNA